MEALIARAGRMACRTGRGVYVVEDSDGGRHAFLSLHKPARKVLGVVGLEEDGSVVVVWMEEGIA